MELKSSGQFKRDFKTMEKQGRDVELLVTVLEKLKKDEKLEVKYRDHTLSGDYQGYRECHISPDWLLIYRIEDGFIRLKRTGSHSDLFG